jgi:hypothetical protein
MHSAVRGDNEVMPGNEIKRQRSGNTEEKRLLVLAGKWLPAFAGKGKAA